MISFVKLKSVTKKVPHTFQLFAFYVRQNLMKSHNTFILVLFSLLLLSASKTHYRRIMPLHKGSKVTILPFVLTSYDSGV